LTLSRLRWSRAIPNPVAFPPLIPSDTGGWPVAIPSGIQLPLSGTTGWLPGFFARDDGTYTPFPVSALGDGGFGFRGFDGQGNPMANHFDRQMNQVDVMFFAPGSAVPIAPASASTLHTSNDQVTGGAAPLARLSNRLCETWAQGCGSVNEVNCVSPAGST